jgi:hypothetical protein
MEATEVEKAPKRSPVLHKVVAGLVLIAAAALAIHLIAGLLLTIFWVALAVTIVIAVIWALRTIRS